MACFLRLSIKAKYLALVADTAVRSFGFTSMVTWCSSTHQHSSPLMLRNTQSDHITITKLLFKFRKMMFFTNSLNILKLIIILFDIIFIAIPFNYPLSHLPFNLLISCQNQILQASFVLSFLNYSCMSLDHLMLKEVGGKIYCIIFYFRFTFYSWTLFYIYSIIFWSNFFWSTLCNYKHIFYEWVDHTSWIFNNIDESCQSPLVVIKGTSCTLFVSFMSHCCKKHEVI